MMSVALLTRMKEDALLGGDSGEQDRRSKPATTPYDDLMSLSIVAKLVGGPGWRIVVPNAPEDVRLTDAYACAADSAPPITLPILARAPRTVDA
jgi:hypothetical protein